MSTSTSALAIEKQMVPENEVQQVELLTGVEDSYGGIIVDMEKPVHSEAFASILRASISQWKQQVSNSIYLLFRFLIATTFQRLLLNSSDFNWQSQILLQGKRAVWIKLPIELANLVEPSVKVKTFTWQIMKLL